MNEQDRRYLAAAADRIKRLLGARSATPLRAGALSPDLQAFAESFDNLLEHLSLIHIYHLDNSLLCKLKRALFYYTEETQRENLAITQEGDLIQRDVFVNRYQRATHGCRDPQPEYWREYQ